MQQREVVSVTVCGSYREVAVVPAAAAVLLVLYGEVTGGLLRQFPPFTSFPPGAAFVVRAPGASASLGRRVAPLPAGCFAIELVHQVVATPRPRSWSSCPPCGRVPGVAVGCTPSPALPVRLVAVFTQDAPSRRSGVPVPAGVAGEGYGRAARAAAGLAGQERPSAGRLAGRGLDYGRQGDHPPLHALDAQLVQRRQHAGRTGRVRHRLRRQVRLRPVHVSATVTDRLRGRRHVQPSHLVLQVVQDMAGSVHAALNATVHVVVRRRRGGRSIMWLHGSHGRQLHGTHGKVLLGRVAWKGTCSQKSKKCKYHVITAFQPLGGSRNQMVLTQFSTATSKWVCKSELNQHSE